MDPIENTDVRQDISDGLSFQYSYNCKDEYSNFDIILFMKICRYGSSFSTREYFYFEYRT